MVFVSVPATRDSRFFSQQPQQQGRLQHTHLHQIGGTRSHCGCCNKSSNMIEILMDVAVYFSIPHAMGISAKVTFHFFAKL
jgi:hypothetical protein